MKRLSRALVGTILQVLGGLALVVGAFKLVAFLGFFALAAVLGVAGYIVERD